MYICSFFLSLSDSCTYSLRQSALQHSYHVYTILSLSVSIAIYRIYRDLTVGAGSSIVHDRMGLFHNYLFRRPTCYLISTAKRNNFRILPTRFQQDVCSHCHPTADRLSVSTTIMQLPMLHRHAASQLIDLRPLIASVVFLSTYDYDNSERLQSGCHRSDTASPCPSYMAARRQPDDGYLALNIKPVSSDSFNSCTANTTECRLMYSVCSTSVEPSAALALIKPVCVRAHRHASVRPSAASSLHTATAGSIVPSASVTSSAVHHSRISLPSPCLPRPL
jgi:hypothetical protein